MKKLLPLSFSLFFMGVLVLGGTCLFAEENTDVVTDPVPEEAEEPLYQYQGDQFRDPFAPLVGLNIASFQSANLDVTFNPATVTLRGILKTPTGRWAIIKDETGSTFYVKKGKVFTAKKKPVSGYVGIVKEKSLVLIGPDNVVKELSIRKNAEVDTEEEE